LTGITALHRHAVLDEHGVLQDPSAAMERQQADGGAHLLVEVDEFERAAVVVAEGGQSGHKWKGWHA
jgi:hypothetical protein